MAASEREVLDQANILWQIERELLCKKGKSYNPGTDDRLANFKRVAERLNLDPLKVWGAYFLKHVDAICTMVLTGANDMEGFTSRATDLRNYLVLGTLLWKERSSDQRHQNKGEGSSSEDRQNDRWVQACGEVATKRSSDYQTGAREVVLSELSK